MVEAVLLLQKENPCVANFSSFDSTVFSLADLQLRVKCVDRLAASLPRLLVEIINMRDILAIMNPDYIHYLIKVIFIQLNII